MKRTTAARVITRATLLLLLAACAGIGHAVPQTYTRTIQPLGNGFGIASITDTEISTDPAYTTRSVSGSGICSAFQSGNLWRVNGALLDFGNVPGGTSANDVIGCYFTFDPAHPDTLNVWRNLIASIDPTATNNVRGFGYGGMTGASGLMSLRIDGYSGGIAGNALGTLKVDAADVTTFGTTYPDSTAYWHLLVGGQTVTDTWAVAPIGEHQDLMASSSFAMYLADIRANITGGTGNLNPHGQLLTATATDHRGSPALNDTAHVVAAVTVAQAGDPTAMKGEYFRLRVIKYTDNGTTVNKTSENTYSFRSIGDGKTYAFANFFSRSSYGGPQEISINDNGDIAFPVVINVVGNTSSDNPYRLADRRGILFMSHLTPGTFKCVVDNQLAAPVTLYGGYSPAFGGVAIDNDCNVYFSYVNWMGAWGGGTKSTNAIYKASADNRTSPASWSIDPILWRGCTWKDGSQTCELSTLPLGNTGTEWYANSAAFCCQNINRTKLPGKSDPRYSVGGFFFGAGVSIDGVTGNAMRGLYLAPTDQLPVATNIQKAKSLANGEAVNLRNCVITRFADPYIDPVSNNTYYQCYVSDSSHSRLRVSSIRADASLGGDLQIGDRIYVSGYMATESTGERYLASSGLVLVANGDTAAPIAMNSRAIGSGSGLSTEGRWAKLYGRVTSVDTTAQTFALDDGGTPVLVKYDPSVSITAGKFVSVSGDVAGGTLQMQSDDTIVILK